MFRVTSSFAASDPILQGTHTHQTSAMFANPVLYWLNGLLLIGIVLIVIAARVIIRSTRKQRHENLALRKSLHDGG